MEEERDRESGSQKPEPEVTEVHRCKHGMPVTGICVECQIPE